MGCGASAERRSAPSASFHGPTAMELQALIQSYRLRIVQVQRCDVRQAHSIPERRHAERLHAAADAVARPTAACRASCTTCVDEHDMRGEAAESRCTGSSQQSLSAVLPCCTVDMDQEMVMDEALMTPCTGQSLVHLACWLLQCLQIEAFMSGIWPNWSCTLARLRRIPGSSPTPPKRSAAYMRCALNGIQHIRQRKDEDLHCPDQIQRENCRVIRSFLV
ncbi:unnamed protein product [Durusdinium trenchii]|uniref:Uncharacterized protein n=1 Tax=Durusdinium trenchii TaxID=1381693 RepID=A0ABP0RMG1_9DINO